MWRNALAAALRNLFRNRAYAALNIFGLALAFTAALLISLFVRDEYSFDRFFPEHERIYRVMSTVTLAGQAPLRVAPTSSNIGPALQLDFPEVEAATRISPASVTLRQGSVESRVQVYWADPNFFDVLPLAVRSGNAREALRRPDSLVLTRRMAQQLFGRDDVVGRPVTLNREHTLRVAAVLADLPTNSHLDAEIFAPGIASFSRLTSLDTAGADSNALRVEGVYTYVRLRKGTSADAVREGLRSFADRHVGGEIGGIKVSTAYRFDLVPIANIHLEPRSLADMRPAGDLRTLHAMIGVALLVLFVGGSNFVSMMTARASRRAVEVGVRKAEGATRRQIIVQFLGECLFYATLALVIALLAVAVVLPAFNAFLQRDIGFAAAFLDPAVFTGTLAVWALTALAAGTYPALVLSTFRPSAVLKGVVALPGGSGVMRQTLVIFQFGAFIALIVATLTIQRQTQYAMEGRLRLPSDQIFISPANCNDVFTNSLAAVRGVLKATCGSGSALAYDHFGTVFAAENGSNVSFGLAPVEQGFLELFGVAPLAGRLFAADRGEDEILRGNPKRTDNPSIIINESGVRALGFASPDAAVGQYRRWVRAILADGGVTRTESLSSRIIGVIPDFSVGSVRDVIEPTAYYVDPSATSFLVLKLDGQAIPDTMRAVQALWTQREGAAPFEGRFLSQSVNELYADIQRQSALFSAFAGVALVVAALGLLGLAVFTAERRTREIGLRKVMGASRWDILRFLAWHFTRPILIANLLAWPLAYYFMRRWLEGFAYHVDLSPLIFVAASTLALLIALLTVASHALLVARAKPVEALRYE